MNNFAYNIGCLVKTALNLKGFSSAATQAAKSVGKTVAPIVNENWGAADVIAQPEAAVANKIQDWTKNTPLAATTQKYVTPENLTDLTSATSYVDPRALATTLGSGAIEPIKDYVNQGSKKYLDSVQKSSIGQTMGQRAGEMWNKTIGNDELHKIQRPLEFLKETGNGATKGILMGTGIVGSLMDSYNQNKKNREMPTNPANFKVYQAQQANQRAGKLDDAGMTSAGGQNIGKALNLSNSSTNYVDRALSNKPKSIFKSGL